MSRSPGSRRASWWDRIGRRPTPQPKLPYMRRGVAIMRTFGVETIAALAVVVSAISLTGCRGSDARANAEASAAVEVSSVPVAAVAAFKRDIPVVVRATGTFMPDEASDVAAQVSGQVVKTLVNVGDIVKADQSLVLLDDRDARLRLDQARA